MSKLGSLERPAVVRVRDEDTAEVIFSVCEERGWQVMIGIDPHRSEDVSDFERLLNPPESIFFGKIEPQLKHSKNGPCPCGSGNKYKKCCMEKDLEGVL